MSNYMMLGAAAEAPTGYEITDSIMLDSEATQYLSRTYTVGATNSVSLWVKRGKLGTIQPIIEDVIEFNANDTLTVFGTTTAAVFRDPTGWYHFFIGNGKFTVNGVDIATPTIATFSNKRIGYDGTNKFDGYISDIHLIDGTALDVTSFGETDANGHWVAKAYTGSYGTNGFHLDFSNGSALGADVSGRGNNWTVNGGINSTNQVSDTPTNNYAVINSVAPYSNLVMSLGNSKATSSAAYRSPFANMAITSGKWYWECSSTSVSGDWHIGIANGDPALWMNTYAVIGPYGYAIISNGSKYHNGVSTAYGSSYWVSNKISVAFDADNGTITFYRDGVSQGVAFTGLTSGPYYPMSSIGSGGNVIFNFGQRAFAYTPPTGFLALCTGNLDAEDTTNTSGSFTGNAAADGPFVWAGGVPDTLTINGNAVTFGTHADKTAGGFKLRTSSASYNASGTNTWTATAGDPFKYATAQEN